MRQIDVPTVTVEGPFDYYCPMCGIELSRYNYETPEKDHACPFCGTRQRASRAPARRW